MPLKDYTPHPPAPPYLHPHTHTHFPKEKERNGKNVQLCQIAKNAVQQRIVSFHSEKIAPTLQNYLGHKLFFINTVTIQIFLCFKESTYIFKMA